MESYCSQKTSIVYWINNGSFSQALAPCLKAECDQWGGGECIQIRKAGKISSSGYTGSDFKVSVQSISQPTIKDLSNNYFTLTF